jgi:hypothetical protein
MSQMMNGTEMSILEFANSGTGNTLINNSYEEIRNRVVRYLSKQSDQHTVDYLEVLQINDLSGKKYLKDFFVIVSTRVAGETRILALQHHKKPLLLNFTNQLGKTVKKFIKLVKAVFDPQITTVSRKTMGNQREIKEWMR